MENTRLGGYLDVRGKEESDTQLSAFCNKGDDWPSLRKYKRTNG